MADRFSMISLGCPKNFVDSGNLVRSLIHNGFLYAGAGDDVDIFLINTCGFIEDAKKESVDEILRLCEIKKGSRGQGVKGPGKKVNHSLEPSNPQTLKPCPKLIVFGCLAKRYKDHLIKEIPEIDAIFGVGEDERIIEYCKGQGKTQDAGYRTQDKKNQASCIVHHASLPLASPSYAYLKISDGCNKRCSYCVIPSIRGRYRSIGHDEITREAERLIKAGVKEIILVGQDTACYGRDIKPPDDIASLLKDLCSISGDFRIRLLYAYPASISESLINVIAEEEKICKYLDIPLQHSEDRILRLMKRQGTRDEYLKLIRHLRRNMPDIALRTTFIVGFPSETEEEFSAMLDFIEEARFDRLGAFKYSKEEGTSAAKLKGQISNAVKNNRYNEIMKRQSLISLEKNKKLIGKRFKAIIDEVDDKLAVGRLYSHTPEIDGAVIIEKGSRGQGVKGSSERVMPQAKLLNPRTLEPYPFKAGDFAEVEITDALDYDLKGILV